MNCKNCGIEIFKPKKTWCNPECNKKYLQSPKAKFHIYKKNAISRKKSFDLTLKEFESFWQIPCSYCGDKIKYIGLDRVDNSRGYNIHNVVPCCTPCNFFKRERTVKEFVEHCKRIIKTHKKNNHSIL